MAVSLFSKNRESTRIESRVSVNEAESLDETTPIIVLIDLGLCGVDSWGCYHQENHQLVQCQ